MVVVAEDEGEVEGEEDEVVEGAVMGTIIKGRMVDIMIMVMDEEVDEGVEAGVIVVWDMEGEEVEEVVLKLEAEVTVMVVVAEGWVEEEAVEETRHRLKRAQTLLPLLPTNS